jgi:hypothetical protein
MGATIDIPTPSNPGKSPTPEQAPAQVGVAERTNINKGEPERPNYTPPADSGEPWRSDKK